MAEADARIVPLVTETILFGLTLAALPERMRNAYAGRNIADVILRDGTWAFALMFGECDFREVDVLQALTVTCSDDMSGRHFVFSSQNRLRERRILVCRQLSMFSSVAVHQPFV